MFKILSGNPNPFLDFTIPDPTNSAPLRDIKHIAAQLKCMFSTTEQAEFKALTASDGFKAYMKDDENPSIFGLPEILPENPLEFEGLLYFFNDDLTDTDLKTLLSNYEKTHGADETTHLIKRLIEHACPQSDLSFEFDTVLKKCLTTPALLKELTAFTVTKYTETLDPDNTVLDYITHLSTLSTTFPEIVKTCLSDHLKTLSLPDKIIQLEKLSQKLNDLSPSFKHDGLKIIVSEYINEIRLTLFTDPPPEEFDAQLATLFNTWATVDPTHSPSVNLFFSQSTTSQQTIALTEALQKII
ncbi:hypothetical protein HOH45_04695, partial [bacterium]|nr:hypothetical protein [bacterium]